MDTRAYFKHSSHNFYGAVVALVMLVLYESLIIWGEQPSGMILRNAPEAWVRSILYFLGISHYYITFALLSVFLLALPVFYRPDVKMDIRIIIGMVIESILWGLISGLVIRFFLAQLMMASGPLSNSALGNLGLAIGAGLFEELFFRVFLTSVLIAGFLKVFRYRWIAVFSAIVVASFLFSLAHYVGNASDDFAVYSFMFRFLAGFWFTTLYAMRGFAVTGMSHAFYDIFVIFF